MSSKLSAAVGGLTAKKFEESFGYETVGDLLGHYPRAYVERGATSNLSTFAPGEHTTVVAEVVSSSLHPYKDRRTGQPAFRVEVLVAVGEGRLWLTFFDKFKHTAQWRSRRLSAGQVGMFEGRADWDRFKNRWQLVHPQTDILERSGDVSAEEQARTEVASLSPIRPVYAATKKLSSWVIENSVGLVLDMLDEVPEPLPATLRFEQDLLSTRRALEWIHRPESWKDKSTAETTLRFSEAFVTQTALAQRRVELAKLSARPRIGLAGGLLDRFDQRVPFELTTGQREVSSEILEDLSGASPMHRLLQGEVGSGKTLVALRAMLRVVDSGGQAALLAPTEVLAQQHSRSITAMLGDLAAGGQLGGAEDGTQIALLTGSLSSRARKAALLDAASGAAGIVIGTHALLEERVQFADLGLVVVDEQHRFGVEQRAALTAKGGEKPPHVLVMTATPIPRTVAMTVFGDLETSTLRELPAGRAQIQTSVVPAAERPDWLERAWARVREETQKGRQSYIVCPRIAAEPSDEEERPAADVEGVTSMLTRGPLADVRVEMLHGRLAPERKEEVMRAFADGEIDVLVSTTVVEVGVDVANATVMAILDADRFGVSQLHQLRGRVGRGASAGLCLLVTRAEAGTAARARLEAVAKTSDGFELSRIDLEHRREGDVLGVAQSGKRTGLRLLSVLRHEQVIVAAREAASALVSADPDLAGEPGLAAEVRRLAESEQAAYLDKA